MVFSQAASPDEMKEMKDRLGDYIRIDEHDGFLLYGRYAPHRQKGPFSTYYVLAVRDKDTERIGFCQMLSASYLIGPTFYEEEREPYLKDKALKLAKARIDNGGYEHDESYEDWL